MNDLKLTTEDVIALKRYDAPTIANAIETFGVRSYSDGFMSPEIRCVFPNLGPLAGFAVTGTMRAREKSDRRYSRNDWFDLVVSLPKPRVIVLQDLDDEPCGAFWGEIQANIHKALGCAGVVTNGGVRDLREVEAAGFQYYAGSVMVSHAYVHLEDAGVPVRIGGLDVRTGDVIHADVHGVQVIPAGLVRELPAACEELVARERKIISYCQSAEFTVEGLKKLF
jgi:regulator of RNase E activity RraA